MLSKRTRFRCLVRVGHLRGLGCGFDEHFRLSRRLAQAEYEEQGSIEGAMFDDASLY